jgi:hypothetical protein
LTIAEYTIVVYLVQHMEFYGQQLLKSISIAAMLATLGGCTQDTMIRVGNTSTLKLVPTTEIRFRACGDTPANCQSIFNNIAYEKSQFVTQARAKYQEYIARQRIVAQQEWQNRQQQSYKLFKCTTSHTSKRPYYPGMGTNTISDASSSPQCYETSDRTYNPPFRNIASSYKTEQEPTFTPTEEDIKKIIKEVSSTNLNEYTFSKADGSIVVICPTKYCAIGSGDGGWIGIGESGKSIDATSVVRAQS